MVCDQEVIVIATMALFAITGLV